jgi:hypothetical protein
LSMRSRVLRRQLISSITSSGDTRQVESIDKGE